MDTFFAPLILASLVWVSDTNAALREPAENKMICLRNATNNVVSAVVTGNFGDRVVPYAFQSLRPRTSFCLDRQIVLEVRLLPGDEYAERSTVVFPDTGIRPLGDDCNFPIATAGIVDVVEGGGNLGCVVTTSVATSVSGGTTPADSQGLCIENKASVSVLVFVTANLRGSDYQLSDMPYAMPILRAGEVHCLEQDEPHDAYYDYSVRLRVADEFLERQPIAFPNNLPDGPACGARSFDSGRLVVTQNAEGFVCRFQRVGDP